jgi:hypothetical protein
MTFYSGRNVTEENEYPRLDFAKPLMVVIDASDGEQSAWLAKLGVVRVGPPLLSPPHRRGAMDLVLYQAAPLSSAPATKQ